MNDDIVNSNDNRTFSVLGEIEGRDKPLLMNKLSFARIIDDIIVPYESGVSFFLDGVPVQKDKIRQIKIIRETHSLRLQLQSLHRNLHGGNAVREKDIADQYYIRVEAILRDTGEDVTSQVIKAFDTSIRPRLKDYLPNRQELIQAATLVFIEGMKFLNNKG